MFILFTTINVPNSTEMKTRRGAGFPQAKASSQIIEIKCRHQTQGISHTWVVADAIAHLPGISSLQNHRSDPSASV